MILRASGFGQTGPFAGRSAFNPVGLAYGGLMYLGGWPDRPPLRDGVQAGDYSTALFGFFGTVAALLRRELDGEGQVAEREQRENGWWVENPSFATIRRSSPVGIGPGRASSSSHPR